MLLPFCCLIEHLIDDFNMFCSVCGNKISENHKFCIKCGNARPMDANNGLQKGILKPRSSIKLVKSQNTSECSTPTFETFQTTKRNERASSFRSNGKAAKRKKSVDYTTGEVVINFGIMFFNGNQLKPQRSKNLSVKVPKVSTKDELLAAGLAKHKAHSTNLVKDGVKYVLLYPDGALVSKLRESDDEFTLYKYKREYGKAYQRINFYICPSRDYNDYTVSALTDVFAESSESDKGAVTSDTEIVDLTYKTDTSETTSNMAAAPGKLSASLRMTNSVNARLKTKENGTSSMVTATLESLPSSSCEATSFSHQGNTLSTQSGTLGENLECLYESITELFPQCNPAQARDALLATNNTLEAAVNLIISNQTQSITTHEGIYASFNFCNDITNDPEFTENNNQSDDKAVLHHVGEKKQLNCRRCTAT